VGPRLGAVALALTLLGPLALSGPRVFAQRVDGAPRFHHLHLNSVNPEAAIEFYTKAFPSTSKDSFAGQPALRSPNDVWVLFNKVATPPPTQPETAFWHFGWHVTDVRATLDRYLKQGIPLLPLYTGLPSVASAKEGVGSGTVFISSDTYPGTGGVLGLTRAQLDDAKAKGVKPNLGAGFAYLRGPDDAIVEYQGNMPAERFNHVHMYQDQPFCAALWYQAHLNVPAPAPRPGAASARASAGQAVRTEANCKVERGPDKTFPALDWDGMYRTPAVQTTTFGDVALYMYMNQRGTPAGPTRGQLIDHFAVGVANLDAWLAKLQGENVTILEPPYTIGTTRAFMIEGPSREAIEILEVKNEK
jgi:catechol 2,3-dioxygenase-like lactoylglutathione lyase family enzyme